MHTPLQQHVEALQADPNVLGILLFGSWARGNNRPDSDVDLLVIVREGFKRTVEYRDGQVFEITYTTEQGASQYWHSAPDDAVELWSIATMLFDRDGTIARLKRMGQAIQDQGKAAMEPDRYAHAQFDMRDQLRAVEKLAASDQITARLILSTKIVQLTELYFDLRQLWTPPPKQRLEILMRNDRAVYDLVVAYYEEASLPRQITIARALFDAVFDH
jgi:hypothetical protein